MPSRKPKTPPGTRWCPACRTAVANVDYSRNRTGPEGFGAYCNACKSAKSRARRAARKSLTAIDQATIARFWKRVNKEGPNGCWLWIGAPRNKDGYGAFEVNGVSTQPHIVVFRIGGVDIPKGMVVDHVCRVRMCCNPAHLRIVPPTVNALENNLSPFAINARARACKYGHPFTAENTSRHLIKNRKTRHGKPTKPSYTRVCLACKRARYHRMKGQQA